MEFVQLIRNRARKARKTIVLPEGLEERTLKAASVIMAEGLADIILLGDEQQIAAKAQSLSVTDISRTRIINPLNHPDRQVYAETLHALRKHKGLTADEALRLVEDPLYLAVMLIKDGKADGEVAGAINATGNVLRPAFQVIKTQPGIDVVSGAFFMVFDRNPVVPGGILVFADCAVNPDPTATELAQIAISTARTARNIAGIEPVVAMLSFSTKGSARHAMCDKVIQATEIARNMDPTLEIDGELQADAALIERIGQSKAPGSRVAGRANVLIFPDLQSGNIAYKLVQRLAGAQAIGPVLQGMAAPINDLSRGCSVSDIVNLVAITAAQACEN